MRLPQDVANKTFNCTMKVLQCRHLNLKRKLSLLSSTWLSLREHWFYSNRPLQPTYWRRLSQPATQKVKAAFSMVSRKGILSFLFQKGRALKVPCPHHLECFAWWLGIWGCSFTSLLCNYCSPLIFSTITGKKSRKKHLNSSTVSFNYLVPCGIMNLSQFHD